MAKHRRSRRQHNNPRSHERSEFRAFNDRGSIGWDAGDHRRESRLGSHLVSNARVEEQNNFERPWRRYELQRPHDHRQFDNGRLHHRSASTPNAFQQHNDLRYRKYDHIIRDLFVQGSVIEQKLKRLMEGLSHLQPSSEEMEWENTNSVYYVPLALANVMGGRNADVAASLPRQEGADTETGGGGTETSALGLGPQGTGLPSLQAPQPAALSSRLLFQNFEKALLYPAAVALDPESYRAESL